MWRKFGLAALIGLSQSLLAAMNLTPASLESLQWRNTDSGAAVKIEWTAANSKNVAMKLSRGQATTFLGYAISLAHRGATEFMLPSDSSGHFHRHWFHGQDPHYRLFNPYLLELVSVQWYSGNSSQTILALRANGGRHMKITPAFIYFFDPALKTQVVAALSLAKTGGYFVFIAEQPEKAISTRVGEFLKVTNIPCEVEESTCGFFSWLFSQEKKYPIAVVAPPELISGSLPTASAPAPAFSLMDTDDFYASQEPKGTAE